MPQSVRPGRRSPLPTLLMSALLSAVFVFAMTAIALPGTASASVVKEAACNVNLRTSASTSARIKATLKAGTKVTVVTSVTGSAWRATCNGKTISSKYWYRISAVNGKSAKSLYGVTYVYGALYMFRPVTSPGYHALRRVHCRPADQSVDDGAVEGPHRHRYQGVRGHAGHRHDVVGHLRGQGRVESLLVPDQLGQRPECPIAVRREHVYAANGLFKTAPGQTPAPPPAPGGSIAVPASIDATGVTDAGAALNSWLGSVPSGSTVLFKAGGVYRMDRGLKVSKTQRDLRGQRGDLEVPWGLLGLQLPVRRLGHGHHHPRFQPRRQQSDAGGLSGRPGMGARDPHDWWRSSRDRQCQRECGLWRLHQDRQRGRHGLVP